jgi:hypothetical protein
MPNITLLWVQIFVCDMHMLLNLFTYTYYLQATEAFVNIQYQSSHVTYLNFEQFSN